MALRSDSSSSMASSQACFSYDVFLSFRGEDTRKTFTDHLYTALKQAGIRTFRDEEAMDRGKLLKPELKKAIHESAISIIVFSKSFASSKWCLDEVLMIIEEQEMLSSKNEVVPVFYHVEPSDVRNQRGSFEDAFNVYDDIIKAETNPQKKMEWLEKVNAWRGALKKAGTFTGMVFADGYETKFIIDIVNVIRNKLNYKALYIEEKLVGITEDVAQIESWLQDPSPNSAILLIDGMGGIGKTTIAKCIYNSSFHEFDCSCFLADINETSKQPLGLLRLQSQLLSTLLKSEKEETIWNVHEGTIKVMDAISNKKVLLVLDDVTTPQQLDALLGRQRFYPGSKAIITTRHKWLLNSFVVYPKVQTLNTLSIEDSIELFSLHAFHQDQHIELYTTQLKASVRHCMGLPLALKVLGSSLRGKSIDEWEDAMCKLEAIHHPGIQKVIQLSYESLEDDKDKDLFLHIACFFVNEDKDYIVKLLAECNLYPIVGIKNLMDRCLLYVENGKVEMHQVIKQMGQEVVRQESPKDPGKRSRLWRHEDCYNVLQETLGTKRVEGLMLDMRMMKEAKSTLPTKIDNPRKCIFEETRFKIGALEKMKNLMLLQLNYVKFSGKYRKLPKKLRLLRWHGFSLKSIPIDIPLENLVVLDLSYSKLECVWDDLKFIGSLKILNLSYSVELIKSPDFRGLPGLESLILKGCLSLAEVSESISCLERLVLLDLTDCRNLRYLPFLPRSLVSLQMSGCPNLGLGLVQCLDSVSLPSLLVDVDISNCNLFDYSFPNDWSSLASLEYLKIDGNNVTSLPKCIQSLPRLLWLSVRKCSQIQSVVGLPKSVDVLYTIDNMCLEKVQPAQSMVYTYKCHKLCDVEGRYKLRTIDKVDKKIIRYLGLESIAGERMELNLDCKQEVLYEFGIFSTYVSGKQIPSSFTFREKGPEVSFKVPLHPNGSKISGFNMCLVLSQSGWFPSSGIEIYNMSKALLWRYISGNQKIPEDTEKYAWLSLWRCGNLLEAGDEILVHISREDDEDEEAIVEECCINLIYEDDEFFKNDKELDGAHDVNAFDQMSWTDRMLIEISDYVHNGNKYSFGNYKWGDSLTRCLDGGWYNLPDRKYESLLAHKRPQTEGISLWG